MKIVVIMPTYNEVENIGKMIDTLAGKVFPQIVNHQLSLLVVDDYSPDGTGKVVRQKMKKFTNLFLIEGQRSGLGMAYLRGFKYALDRLKAEAVMEMDADFQHSPFDVIRFVQSLEEGYDLVLGSRFIKGGAIPKNWALKRKILSTLGNLFIRAILSLWEIHDITTGFRLTRVKGFLDQINKIKLLSTSYAYKIQVFYEMKKRGARVKEIPIKFNNREKGWSKMDSEDFRESLKVVLAIRFRKFLSL